ncbi:hypothetical protein GIB67_039635 [Kingdonia uniflora]|uniref:CWF21 domain-containing protein n=1 Tax=Kingdonia uniflora TaxID=39325 RepID=A0A7J7MDV8_9MAGN|nr:hypothetical protein GIB67_039635 [Kingdonia uniflora]
MVTFKLQTNKFFVRPRSTSTEESKGSEGDQGIGGEKMVNKDLLEHERKRRIQLKLVVLEDKLSDQGYTGDEIALKLNEARETLEASDGIGTTAQSTVHRVTV